MSSTAGPLGPSDAPTVRIDRGRPQRSTMVWQALSALTLLAMGGIHLYLALTSTGGILGVLFILNAVGGFVLAVGVLVLRGWLLATATVLALLFLAGTLLSLVLALTVGLFGIESSLDEELAPTTLVVESVGVLVLLVTTVLVLRRHTAR
jgi:hypothetical protein